MVIQKERKYYKGEKYIYLLMAYQLAKQNSGAVTIGHDNSYKGGFNFERRFKIDEYKGEILLSEIKGSKAFADYDRTFRVSSVDSPTPSISDYMNEDGENCGQGWTH